MRGLVTTFLFLAICQAIKGATTGTSCETSHECGKGFCCRDANNKVLSANGRFGILLAPGNKGTCTQGKANKSDVCDSDCQCDTGFTCYRPMSGVCCLPMTCHDTAYVIKQQEYWRDCLSNPKCALPP
ncbi:hypothetical protein SNE40_023317 [Patella caerulea]|uniref:Uncharacterized protein n=1 Tax=Patella caerulea TaxID=87958 RepID=A0AAN8GHW4_PATCE